MENIEEHCEDNVTENEHSSFIEKTSGLLSSKQTSLSTAPSSNKNISSTINNSLPIFRSNVGKNNMNNLSKFNSGYNSTLSSSEPHLASLMAATGSSVSNRMPHLHKLEKKHSSGDLHSRLKTRKLLGVGETDDGDIHRSKLSQILGHSDQLYIRLPYGLRLWQLFMAVMFTFTGLWALILPSHLFRSAPIETGDDSVALPGRLYGGAILSLSLLYWMTLSSQDRDVIRMCMLTSVVYFVIQFVATSAHLLLSPEPTTRHPLLLLSFRGVCMLLSFLYHWALVQRKLSPMKPSASNRELNKEK